MAAHDPDPTVHQKQLELKLGRQKKVQIIDGQQVEVMQGIGSDEEEEIDMMAVEGSDGQQYVVLEVIQLADGDDQTMVVGGDAAGELLDETILPDNDLNDEEVLKALQSARRITKQEMEDEEEEELEEDEEEEEDEKKVSTDMQNCFGFDDEEEDDDGVRTGKETITLLGV